MALAIVLAYQDNLRGNIKIGGGGSIGILAISFCFCKTHLLAGLAVPGLGIFIYLTVATVLAAVDYHALTYGLPPRDGYA